MSSQIEEKVIALLETLVDNSVLPINLDDHLVDDLDLDSLHVVDITLMCEDDFGIEIFDEDMDNTHTVSDIIQIVKDRI